MECPYCKAKNRDEVRYCSNCGKMIGQSTSLPADGSPRSLIPGSRLQGGRYVIKKILGQGGMGAALLATDIRLDGKPVVLKELITDNTDAVKLQEDVRNFKREVATLAHIDHPLVPSVTDHFQEGTRYFMVQEYVEGENLEERIGRVNQPMRERDTLVCASEILDILDYLAQQTPPIIHRDIKPANIIIGTKDKRAHLVDFGIARAEVARNAQRKQTSALGTPGYAPPEQYQGNADPRSDLYALAATLHHVLTNRDPRNHAPFSYPLARTLNPQLSPEIEGVLSRALVNDLDKRYQSATAMKQDIDDILRKRFGISGNISSYMLGTPDPINGASSLTEAPVPTTTIPQPTVNNPQTPPTLPGVPQPLVPSAYQPMGVYSNNPSPKPQRQNRTGLLLTVLALLLILFSIFATYNYLHINPVTTPSASSATGIGVTRVGNENIGISDGSFAFDTGRPDGGLKMQAAQKLRQKNADSSSVMSLLNQAIAQDTNDAEALIYLEDLRVLDSGSPYITIVIGTMLSDNDASVGVGRDDLQGAYIAQKEFNDGSRLPGGMKVRLLIASSGSKQEYVVSVAQQIVQLAQADKTFVGVMGWPYSSRSINAISVLSKAHIPMISQTSSSDLLTGTSPYFFRVAPSNKIQGIGGAKYAEEVIHAKTVALFLDRTDAYSQSLAQDFSQQFQADGNTIVATETYTVGKPQTLPAALQDALNHHPDIIYFSGYADDVSTLLTDLPAGDMPVLGGDALYELGGYPSSARAGFSRLRFTAFAYPDEWDALGYGANKPAFFASYPAAFDPAGQHTGGPYGFTRADNDVILSYDAMLAVLKGCDLALSAGKNRITPDDLRQGLKQITGANALQGVSGQISFGPDGDPIDKAIVILTVDSDGHIKMEPKVLGRFLK